MSTCKIINKTNSEIRAEMIKGMNPFSELKEVSSVDTIFEALTKLSGMFKIQLVDNAKLAKFKNSNLYFDASGKTERYVFTDTGEMAYKFRTTDPAKISFTEKNNARAKIIDKEPDSVIKADFGTRIHALYQLYMEQVAEQYINSNQPDKIKVKVSKGNHRELQEAEAFFSAAQRNQIMADTKKRFETIIAKQRELNPDGTVAIMAEYKIGSKKTDMMSTVDLMAVFTPKQGKLQAAFWDYKSITPHTSKLDENGNIKEDNWIPFYKMDDIISQLTTISTTLKDELGFEVISGRGVPIQVGFEIKDKPKTGNALNPKITKLKVGGEHLREIPVIYEKTNIAIIDQTIEKLAIQKNNFIVELKTVPDGSARSTILKAKIADIQNQINAVVIDKDLAKVFNLYKKLVDRYFNIQDGALINVNDRYKDQEDMTFNEKYLDDSEIRTLIGELEMLSNIMATSSMFSKQLGTELSAEQFQDISRYMGYASMMIKELKEVQITRMFTDSELAGVESDTQRSALQAMFRRTSEQDNTIIQKVYGMITKARDTKRLKLQKFEAELKKRQLAIEEWGRNNGMTGFSVYSKLINYEKGTLYSRFNSKFKERREELKYSDNKTKAAEEMRKFYKLKSNAKEIEQRRLKRFIIRHGSASPTKEELEELTERFYKYEGINSPNSILFEPNVYFELDIERVIKENPDFLTEEYKQIIKVPALKEYYDFYTKSMYEFNKMANVSQKGTFIANIRKNVIEMVDKGLFKGLGAFGMDIMQEYKNILGVNNQYEDGLTGDTVTDIIDPNTGERKGRIPRLFVNPLYNSDGQIDNTLKSYDLSKSLMLYGEMAMTHQEFEEIEDKLLTIQDLAEDPSNLIGSVAQEGISPTGGVLRKFGVATGVSEYIAKMLNYNIYGVRYSDLNKNTRDAKEKTIRFLKAVDSQNKTNMFTVNIRLALKSWLSTKVFLEAEAAKSIYFTKKQVQESAKQHSLLLEGFKTAIPWVSGGNMWEKDNMYFNQLKFWDIYTDKWNPERLAQLSSAKFMGKKVDPGMANLLGFGDRNIDNQVLFSMIQNYGIHEGKLVRLNKLGAPKVKSLLEASTLKDGQLFIEGLMKKDEKGETIVDVDIYSQFRRAAQNVSASLKGSVNEEDVNQINMTALGSLFMSLKNWLPALAVERLNGIEYNKNTGEISIGRYNSVSNELFFNISPFDKEISEHYKSVNPEKAAQMDSWNYLFFNRLPHLILNIAFKGAIFGVANIGTRALSLATLNTVNIDTSNVFGGMAASVSRDRAEALLEHYKAQHPTNEEIQAITLDEFIAYQQGQMRATAIEASYIITLLLLSLLLYAQIEGDDDEEKDMGYLATVYGFKTFRGVQRELSFFINPNDWTESVKTVTPAITLLLQFFKMITKAADQGWMVATEGDIGRQDPFYYMMPRFIPYANSAWDLYNADYSMFTME